MASQLADYLRAYQTTLYEALADSQAAVRDQSPLDALLSLTEASLRDENLDTVAQTTLRQLAAVASSPAIDVACQTADEAFGTPEGFGDAIYLARWLRRNSNAGQQLARARAYVTRAAVPLQFLDLNFDADHVLTYTAPTKVWELGTIDSAVNSIEYWRTGYVRGYKPAHHSYNRAVAIIAETIDQVGPRAAAVEKLNGLRRLGPPVAVAALLQFHELEPLYACTIEPAALDRALQRSPACPECGFLLGRIAPTADARRVRQAIERGLTTQQRRLAQRVVSRLMAQPVVSEQETLSRFVQVVQASDLNGLALVLDDEMIQFLAELLEPGAAESDIMERLATVYPEVTLANLDSVLAEARRLLAADVLRSGGLLRLGRSRREP